MTLKKSLSCLLIVMWWSPMQWAVPSRDIALEDLSSGAQYRVTITEDLVENKIMLSTKSGHVLDLKGFIGFVEAPRVWLDKFLILHYNIRGGSGSAFSELTIVSMCDSRFKESFRVISKVKSNLKKMYNKEVDELDLYDEKMRYQLSLDSIYHNDNSFVLDMSEFYYISSKANSADNLEQENVLKLNYSSNTDAFYTDFKELPDDVVLDINIPQFNSDFDRKQSFPYIKLLNSEYFKVEGHWLILEYGELANWY